MDRYHMHINEVKTITYLDLTLENMRARIKEVKDITIYEGFLYSFLYIDDIDKIGKGERIVRGRIVKINEESVREFDHRTPFYVSSQNATCNNTKPFSKEKYFTLIVDSSTDNHSKIEELKLTHILDIHDIDYDWKNDDPKLVPEIPEMVVHSKEYGKGDEFLMQEYHRPHPSIE